MVATLRRLSYLSVVALILALATQAAAQAARYAVPARGIFVVGQTLGGVGLGFTEAQVEARWGSSYTVCNFAAYCKNGSTTWFFLTSRSGEPLGVGVRFVGGRAVAVFTLGAVGVTPVGSTATAANWKTSQGLKMLDDPSQIYTLYPAATIATNCIFYNALSMKTGNGVVSSFYLASGVIYGFALSAPGQPICA
jgi:hypothetical protein